MTPRAAGIRRQGSAALDLCNVACGRMDAYWEIGVQRWDVAAGALIVREAGGHVVLINSCAGKRANPGWGAYAASKFGLRALADSLGWQEAQVIERLQHMLAHGIIRRIGAAPAIEGSGPAAADEAESLGND